MTDWRTRLNAALGIPSAPPARKAVTGPGVAAYYNDIPLRMYGDDPQKRAAAFLKAYKVGWFNKAESKIAGDISTLKRTVSHEDDAGDNEATIVEHDLHEPWESLDAIGQFQRLMERPNEAQTGRQLFNTTQIRIDMAGWAFWWMEGAGPKTSGILPTSLYGISPSRLTPSFTKQGKLLGWVLDVDNASGGVPFQAYEILTFSRGSADGGYDGVGVVESVWQELPLSEKMAQHTADVLSTGGRLAGMLWPKERTLEESEFQDAQRSWRSMASSGDAAKRLLMFPEPMEWTSGASTPAEIGIPELATLNRDNILTAFPISPYQLGVPMPGGLNSAETRREDRRDYWEGTIHPRVELLEETIQTGLLSLYEEVLGTSYDFDIIEPSLVDAASLIEKAKAFEDMRAAGFDEEGIIEILELDTLKWTKPAPVVPVINTMAPPPNEATPPAPTPPAAPPKPQKTAEVEHRRNGVTKPATSSAQRRLNTFFKDQQARVVEGIRKTLNSPDPEKRAKAAPTWWDAEQEDEALRDTMRAIYAEVGRGALQTVADTLGRFVFQGATQSIIRDLLQYGGERITDINARTLQAITIELAEGTRRGYSLNQLIEGVADEGYKGILNVGLDNGVPVWDELRAETIARTETMLSYNRATVTGYGEFGVTHLLAYDGDDDEVCAERNGQEFTIDEAEAIDDHPNGTLVWSPVLDKSWHESKAEPVAPPVIHVHMPETKAEPEPDGRLLKAIEALNRPQDIHVHTTPPDVVFEPPIVNVEAVDFDPMLKAIAQLSEDVKNVQPPVVNVPAPVVNVPPAVVNVKAPNVTVQSPDVTDVRIVDDVSPRRVKKVIRGKPTRAYPEGPITGVEE